MSAGRYVIEYVLELGDLCPEISTVIGNVEVTEYGYAIATIESVVLHLSTSVNVLNKLCAAARVDIEERLVEEHMQSISGRTA